MVRIRTSGSARAKAERPAEAAERTGTSRRADMSRQIVIVTGASRGIGAATARLLGREKAAVVVNYRNARAEADAVVNDIQLSGGEAFALQGDVGKEDDVLRLF